MPPKPNELHNAALCPGLSVAARGPISSPGSRCGSGCSRLTLGGARLWCSASAVNACRGNFGSSGGGNSKVDAGGGRR